MRGVRGCTSCTNYRKKKYLQSGRSWSFYKLCKCTESKNKVGGVGGCTSCTNVQKVKTKWEELQVVQVVQMYRN